MAQTLVIIGCGKAKLAPEDIDSEDNRVQAWDLYTSNYSGLKREYAEVFGDEQMVLSAEHGLLTRGTRITPYDTTMGDRDPEAVAEEVATQVREETIIRSAFQAVDVIEVLAGRAYIENIKPVFAPLNVEVRYPLQAADCSGMGAQMGWLRDEIDAALSPTTNGWEYTPEDSMNDHVWVSPDGHAKVQVLELQDHPVMVHDTRLAHGTVHLTDRDATKREAFDHAVGWMQDHDPDGWEHPRYYDRVFDAPEGYDLDTFQVTRTDLIRYERKQTPPGVTAEYLIIEGYRSTGNYELRFKRFYESPLDEWDVVPNRRDECVALPDECGLDAALDRAHEVANRTSRQTGIEAGWS